MGAPVKIVDLARNLILLSGLRPDEDIKIEFTGIRPGEKLYEELNSMQEDTLPTPYEKIKIFTGNGLTLPRSAMPYLRAPRRGRPRAHSQRPDSRLQPQRATPSAHR
jgi:FlaA1/EpsC-like NDP-sugar epimerase